MSETFGQYIRSLREKAGLTQRALSQMVGFRSLAHLSDIESGKRHPSRETLPKFATALGVDVKELEARDERGPVEALKTLLAARPEMVGAFAIVVEAARSLSKEELLRRIGAAEAAAVPPRQVATPVQVPPPPAPPVVTPVIAPPPTVEVPKPPSQEPQRREPQPKAPVARPSDQPTLF